MLLALSVCKIASFVCVESKAELAFIGAQVIFHKVRILLNVMRPSQRIAKQIYRTFVKSIVSNASSRSRSRRWAFVSADEATPPLPILDPTRCWKSILFLGYHPTSVVDLSLYFDDDDTARYFLYDKAAFEG